MNSFGQKLVDDFDAPELAPVRESFIEGACFIYGHTVLQKTIGLGYQSQWAEENLSSRHERNEFYKTVGKLVTPDSQSKAKLMNIGPSETPQSIVTKLKIG